MRTKLEGKYLTAYFADLKEMATGIVDKWMKKIRGDSGGSKDSNGGTYEKGISRNTAIHFLVRKYWAKSYHGFYFDHHITSILLLPPYDLS